jgi:hypothetical protein
MKLNFSINVGECNGTMGLLITNNHREIYKTPANTLSPGVVNISIENAETGIIEITSTGKELNDTVIDDQRSLVKDKSIDIISLSVDFLTLERFHLYHSSLFFDPYFSKNETKKFKLPDQKDLLLWYFQILEKHQSK